MTFFLSVWVQWWQVDKISPIKLYDENKTIAGFQLRHLLHKQGQHQYVKEIMNKLIKLYSDGKIRPCIDSAWAFEDVRNPASCSVWTYLCILEYIFYGLCCVYRVLWKKSKINWYQLCKFFLAKMNELNPVHLSSFSRKSLFHFIHYSMFRWERQCKKCRTGKT